MRKYHTVLLFLLLTTSLESCFVFGVKEHIHWENNKTSARFYKHYDIGHEQQLYLDTSFSTAIRHLYKKDKSQVHDHLQPVQYLVFSRDGYMKSFMINCFVKTNFLFYPKWNYHDVFDTFPPKTMRPIDSLLTLQRFTALVRDTSGAPFSVDTKDCDYVAFVIFDNMLYRVSKGLIKTLKRHSKGSYHVKTYYINSNKAQIWSMVDSTNKKKIRDHYEELR